jgi:hypothetical protein
MDILLNNHPEKGLGLVFHQDWFDGFSWSVSVQGKARHAAKGLSPLHAA